MASAEFTRTCAATSRGAAASPEVVRLVIVRRRHGRLGRPQLLLPARPRPSWLGTSAPALPASALLPSSAGGASAGRARARATTSAALSAFCARGLRRSWAAALPELRLRRSAALPRSGARPSASCPVRQSLPARHLQRQRRRACRGGAGACDRQSAPLRLRRSAVRQSPRPASSAGSSSDSESASAAVLWRPRRPRGGCVRGRPGGGGGDGGPAARRSLARRSSRVFASLRPLPPRPRRRGAPRPLRDPLRSGWARGGAATGRGPELSTLIRAPSKLSSITTSIETP